MLLKTGQLDLPFFILCLDVVLSPICFFLTCDATLFCMSYTVPQLPLQMYFSHLFFSLCIFFRLYFPLIICSYEKPPILLLFKTPIDLAHIYTWCIKHGTATCRHYKNAVVCGTTDKTMYSSLGCLFVQP